MYCFPCTSLKCTGNRLKGFETRWLLIKSLDSQCCRCRQSSFDFRLVVDSLFTIYLHAACGIDCRRVVLFTCMFFPYHGMFWPYHGHVLAVSWFTRIKANIITMAKMSTSLQNCQHSAKMSTSCQKWQHHAKHVSIMANMSTSLQKNVNIMTKMSTSW